jgi:hypothetical protein
MDNFLNKLEALNLAATKHEHGHPIPTSLKISLNGKWYTFSLDRDDKNLQKLVRTMVVAMLRNEIESTEKRVKTCQASVKNAEDVANATLNDYVVEVVTKWSSKPGPDCAIEHVTVRAHSGYDARVMALILRGNVPKDATPGQICRTALNETRLVRTVKPNG